MGPRHTLGPWKLTGDSIIEADLGEGYEQIAAVLQKWHKDGEIRELKAGVWKANARLMTAAPEMLDVLIQVSILINGPDPIHKLLHLVETRVISTISLATNGRKEGE
jgi:hypothetical protein